MTGHVSSVCEQFVWSRYDDSVVKVSEVQWTSIRSALNNQGRDGLLEDTMYKVKTKAIDH